MTSVSFFSDNLGSSGGDDGGVQSEGENGSLQERGEPDPDTINMFVGQIPRSWGELELRQLFQQFGPVYEISIVRDRTQRLPQQQGRGEGPAQSRGCCFVTFYTRKAAMEAQNALHNVKILPGMHHPVQMKPADNERSTAEERKLFVGMLAKKLTDGEVSAMFSPYGAVEDCKVLLGPDGLSKGCAFLTYATKAAALKAIKMMHHSQTMEGCRAPLVVKFADTAREKENKRVHHRLSLMQQQQQQQLGVMGGGGFGGGGSSGSGMGSMGSGSGLGGSSADTMAQAYTGMQQYAASALPSLYGGGQQQHQQQHQQQQQQGLFQQQQHQQGQQHGQQGQQGLAFGMAAGSHKEGPEGANLFVYHLPQEFMDCDLMQMFVPFGNVVSAKVFIDRITKISKCFGFVSYDSAASAQAAIQAMNGFQIGMKRLKVQLKRNKNDGKPY